MQRFAMAVLAFALAGTASAAGWRSLRVDGGSEEAFAQSLEVFKDKLSPAREYVLGQALMDIWTEGEKAAEAEQREFTAEDYYRQLDGLTYDEIVTLTDPTGETAKDRYRTASLGLRHDRGLTTGPAPGQPPRPAGGWGTNAASIAQAQQACGCPSPNGPQGN